MTAGTAINWVKRGAMTALLGASLASWWNIGITREKLAFEQLDKRENIKILENIIEREREYYFDVLRTGSIQTRTRHEDTEAQAGKYFRKDVLPVLDDILTLPSDAPSISVGASKRNTMPSKLLLYGLAGILAIITAYSIIEEKRKFQADDASLGAKARLVATTLAQTSIFIGLTYAIPLISQIKNFYKPGFDDIQVEKMGGGEYPQELAMTMAHEYAHFAQDKAGMNYCRTLWEGHANQIALEAGKKAYAKTGDATYIQSLMHDQIDNLQDVYISLCKKHGMTPSAHIRALWDQETDLTPYSIGSALITIWVEKHGRGVYDKVMHNDFSFIDGKNYER